MFISWYFFNIFIGMKTNLLTTKLILLILLFVSLFSFTLTPDLFYDEKPVDKKIHYMGFQNLKLKIPLYPLMINPSLIRSTPLLLVSSIKYKMIMVNLLKSNGVIVTL